ncbi:phosphoribosylformylglycinamidine synthase subunit PurL [bacterium]|nr:MAG: phosphoribosylformylglycinamidine synthase subunit PurL [bacterium]
MLEIAKQLKLSEEEYNRIVELLGREPNYTELGIFSVMWSEHCSYKSSLIHLKKFPTASERSLTEMGEENAGVLKLKDNWALAFKIESHNHPSAVEPFQGAATGVGGILRDIFCMGAYPIASLDSLHFGELDNPITKHLFDGVVRGIAFYGNCFGVPTVAGEVRFEHAYSGNPLVNAMAVGIVDVNKMISAKAEGIGNPVIYIGASTGRDGIHGASFASDELTESSHQDRPSVQIGDPFTEKLLLEATQEIAEKGLAVGMQDMGAAGLTSSAAEMAAKGKVGIEMNLDKIPLREKEMTPYEIMLSESQERMLLVSTAENLPKIETILRKWGLHYAVIGEVIQEPVLRLRWRGEIAGEIPVNALKAGDGAPVYDLPRKKPAWLEKIQSGNPVAKIKSKYRNSEFSLHDMLLSTLGIPTIASKKWVWRQYDNQVGVRTVLIPGSGDSAVLRLMETEQFIAVCTDCNGAYGYLDPYIGGALAVLESARNVSAVGAKPIGITDCLNFGNPKKPEVMWQFARACLGIADACDILNIPVTGGNVSFYNESPESAIFPTPVVGMVGIIENEKNITPMAFKNSGDIIYLLGITEPTEIGGSALQKVLCGEYSGNPPAPRFQLHSNIIESLLDMIDCGLVESAHDISDGGIAIALAECVIHSQNLGAKIQSNYDNDWDKLLWLFSESQGRFIISVAQNNISAIETKLSQSNIPYSHMGEVIAEPVLAIDEMRWNLEELSKTYNSTIPEAMRS